MVAAFDDLNSIDGLAESLNILLRVTLSWGFMWMQYANEYYHFGDAGLLVLHTRPADHDTTTLLQSALELSSQQERSLDSSTKGLCVLTTGGSLPWNDCDVENYEQNYQLRRDAANNGLYFHASSALSIEHTVDAMLPSGTGFTKIFEEHWHSIAGTGRDVTQCLLCLW